MTKSDQWEFDALRYAQIPELPKELDSDTPVWIFAVAQVLTFNMERSYAIVRNSYGETPNVLKSFGDGGIAEIEHIYPYKFLDKKYVPEFGNEADAKAFLSKVYGVDKSEFAKVKKDALMRLLYNYCIKRQLSDEKEIQKIQGERQIAEAVREMAEIKKENENKE